MMLRRTALLSLAGLAACASPLPAPLWLRLPLDPPGPVPAPAARTLPAALQLQWLPMQLSAHLDREPWLLPSGPARWLPAGGARWAEPLRDSVPRVLRHDLERLLGPSRVWSAPLPKGLQISHQLRLELSALDITPERSGVRLVARWSLASVAQPASAPPLTLGHADFVQPALQASGTDGASGSGSLSPEDWVLVQRQALAQLAVRMAASLPAN